MIKTQLIPTVQEINKGLSTNTTGKTYYEIEMVTVRAGEIKDLILEKDDDPEDFIDYIQIGEGEDDAYIKSIRNALDSRTIDWSKVKTIHYDDSCNLPRFKMGAFCEKHNIKVLRDSTKADVIIYGEDLVKNMIFSTSQDYCKKSKVIARMKKFRYTRNLISEIIPALEACDSEIVLFDEFSPLHDFGLEKREDDATQVHYVCVEDPKMFNLITAPDSKYYSQDVILDAIGGVVIDEIMFKRLCDMLNSKQTENTTVAMEIMANSNYKKSIVYLLQLMRLYYPETIGNNVTRTHVSFKSLRKYLNYEPRNEEGMDDLIKSVIDKGLMTESNYKLILDITKAYVNKEKEDGYGHESNWILVNIDLKDEFKKQVIWDKEEKSQYKLNLEEA